MGRGILLTSAKISGNCSRDRTCRLVLFALFAPCNLQPYSVRHPPPYQRPSSPLITCHSLILLDILALWAPDGALAPCDKSSGNPSKHVHFGPLQPRMADWNELIHNIAWNAFSSSRRYRIHRITWSGIDEDGTTMTILGQAYHHKQYSNDNRYAYVRILFLSSTNQ